MKLFKMTALLAASMMTVAAHAATKDIAVSASIDPTLELVTIGNAPLPDQMKMGFSLSKGLQSVTVPMGILSNSKDKDILISVAEDVSLVATNNILAKAIPLVVKYADKTVTTTATTIKAKELFGEDGNSAGFSNLVVQASGDTTKADAGDYVGTIRLVVTQAASS